MLGAVFQKSKTPSYPPVRGRLDSFSACVSSFHSFLRFFLSFIHSFLSFFLSSFLPQGRSLYLASPLQGDKRGSFYILSAIACGGMLLRHG